MKKRSACNVFMTFGINFSNRKSNISEICTKSPVEEKRSYMEATDGRRQGYAKLRDGP